MSSQVTKQELLRKLFTSIGFSFNDYFMSDRQDRDTTGAEPTDSEFERFVQLQRELEQLSKGKTSEVANRYGELDREAERLWKAHGEEWSAPLKQLSGITDVQFWNGSPGYVTIDPATPNLEMTLKKLAETTPNLHHISFVLSSKNLPVGFFEYLRKYLEGSNVDSLRFSGEGWKDKVATEIASWPCATKLKTLLLHDCDIADPGMKALCNSPNLGQLHELDLSGNYRINTETFNELAKLPTSLPKLRELWLSRIDITDSTAEKLSAIKELGQLSQLDIGDNPISAKGVRYFLKPHLAKTQIGFNPDDLPAATETQKHIRRELARELDKHNGISVGPDLP